MEISTKSENNFYSVEVSILLKEAGIVTVGNVYDIILCAMRGHGEIVITCAMGSCN